MKKPISAVLVLSMLNFTTSVAFADQAPLPGGVSVPQTQPQAATPPAPPAPVAQPPASGGYAVDGIAYHGEYQIKDDKGERFVLVANVYTSKMVDVRELDGSVHTMDISSFKKEVEAQATFPAGQDPFAKYIGNSTLSATNGVVIHQNGAKKDNIFADGRKNTREAAEYGAAAIITAPITVPVVGAVAGGVGAVVVGAAHVAGAVVGGTTGLAATVLHAGVNATAAVANGIVSVVTNPVVLLAAGTYLIIRNILKKRKEKKKEEADAAALLASKNQNITGMSQGVTTADAKSVSPVAVTPQSDATTPTAPVAVQHAS